MIQKQIQQYHKRVSIKEEANKSKHYIDLIKIKPRIQ